MKQARTRTHTTFDLDDESLATCRRLALDEARSLSSIMRVLIREALKARKRLPTSDGAAHGNMTVSQQGTTTG